MLSNVQSIYIFRIQSLVEAASPWFRYVDGQDTKHEVGFEDPRSLLAKFRLVKEYQLAGLGSALGLVMPQTEELLTEEFNLGLSET